MFPCRSCIFGFDLRTHNATKNGGFELDGSIAQPSRKSRAFDEFCKAKIPTVIMLIRPVILITKLHFIYVHIVARYGDSMQN